MTVLGIDDTDSRTAGMCSTYLAALVAEAIEDAGDTVHRRLLVRLNPAVEHKTRGNAALALHTYADPDETLAIASDLIAEYAVADDPRTSPGVVVADRDPEAVPDAVADFARDAVREFHDLDDALAVADGAGFVHRGWGSDGERSADTAGGDDDSDDNDDGNGDGVNAVVGRGRIGALAAVGAWRAFDDWTYEHISYREFARCGTPREVDEASVFAAAEAAYPLAWDTVDRVEGEAVCVPNAPGPILYGIRGDDPETVRRVADGIDSEPVERSALFVTNQGTDAHLRDGDLGDGGLTDLREGRAYRVDATVTAAPETRRGGHVFFDVAAPDGDDADGNGDDAPDSDGDAPDSDGDAGNDGDPATLDCVAFEPTKRFRDRVRDLRVGDRLTLCGEVADGTLKLEKFAVRDPVETVPAVPECPDCGRSMSSAGTNQGYRCRDCGTSGPGKVEAPVDRDLEPGWYEVPPCARRHISKPLVRGGFDAPTHPER